jgi:hypothetical protein
MNEEHKLSSFMVQKIHYTRENIHWNCAKTQHRKDFSRKLDKLAVRMFLFQTPVAI